MKVLVVDDDEANLVLLERYLRDFGFNRIVTMQDPREVVEVYCKERPDLLLIDYRMPHLDGLALLQSLQEHIAKDEYVPVVMLSVDQRPEIRMKALASGAKDFLKKPLDAAEARLRIQNLLETRDLHRRLEQQKVLLEKMVSERTEKLEHAQIEMAIRLARAAEYRDDDTGEHIWRVARLSALVAEEMGLPEAKVELILRASRLHDVGKIAIPDGILLKSGNLTPEEFELVKTHTTVGAHLLSGGHSSLIKMAETIALTHHERWDGKGYPHGLKAEEIPIESRILAVADSFDALTQDRHHRMAFSTTEAVEEIERQRGQQFDPEVVDAFLALHQRGEVQLG
ncbi:MAG: response regulator [Trueperaceae bacterium]|nr:MAG: response regulator [Trueperaceae bacterium]